MNMNAKKVTALALSAVLVLGIGTAAVSAQSTDTPPEPAPRPSVTAAANPAAPNEKDETVYIFTDASGKSGKILVSSWLKNPGRADILKDSADLHSIENVKGTETWTSGAGNSLSWNAGGEDIYYQGISDRQAPVAVRISYTLDGKKIEPGELAGKSGHVSIRFTYENHQTETVTIDGSQVQIHVPFVMLTGLMLPTDQFSNVQVTNAKLENFGNEIAVLGVALPGMQEDLDLDREKLELPAYIEITADVENFELGPTMTVATPALLQKLDTEDLDIGELQEQAEKLTDGVTELLEGSGKLYDGLSTLLEKSGALVSGVNQLSAGASQLCDGASALRGGASQLESGAGALCDGLTKLDSNSAALVDGARTVFNTLLASANGQIAESGLDVPQLTIGNYADTLNAVIASLDETAVYETALRQVTAGVNARRDEITAAVTQVVSEQVTAQAGPLVREAVQAEVTNQVRAQEPMIRAMVLDRALHMTPEQYEAAVKMGLVTPEQQEQVDAAVEAAIAAEIEKQMESDPVAAKIEEITRQKVAEQMASDEIAAVIAENTELQAQKLISETMASPDVQGKLQAAAEGAKALISLKASLDSYNGFYLGLQTYTSGVATAVSGSRDLLAGARTLKDGTDTLGTGADALASGISSMQEQTPALVDGITALQDGSEQLRDGLQTLMDEGVQKIADLTDEDLARLHDRLVASVDAAKRYTSFSGADSDTESCVRFLIKTAEIIAE